MSIDSLTSYNPNNVNDTLYAYQSNNTAPTNPIQQAPGTNYASSVSLETPPDTFEGVNGVKTLNHKNKEKDLSTGLKWLLGIAGTAATIYGGVVAHRAFTKPSIEKVAKNFSEIFRRDVSQEEAETLINNYKKIFKVDNVDDFCTKIFEQVKKDYGYSDINFKLQIEKMADTSTASRMSKSEIAAYQAQTGILKIFPTHFKDGKMCTNDKYEMFKAIIHELQHAKQSEFAYRTNLTKYLDAMQQRSNNTSGENFAQSLIEALEDKLQSKHELAKYMKEGNFKTVEDAKQHIIDSIKLLKEKETLLAGEPIEIDKDEITQVLDNLWGKLEKFKEGSKEYDLGLKYINNEAHYIPPTQKNYDKYRNQLVEFEAFGTEPKAKEVFNYFANIWRLF